MHLGSLFTALASYLDARQHHGRWLLRIDDLDTPRNQTGAVSSILSCLDAFGLHWDGEVYYQSQQLQVYAEVLANLQQRKHIYRCDCSRKSLMHVPEVYPGFCRNKTQFNHDAAIRVKLDDVTITFNDRLQNQISSDIATAHGDFIIKRKDGIVAYQLAVVIDDHAQRINHVVRGCDLLDSTPKQIYLQGLLGYPEPNYAHIPIILDRYGQKLSKQTLAKAIDYQQPVPMLFSLLTLLNQQPPIELKQASVQEVLDWAIDHWQIAALKSLQELPESLSTT